MERVQAAMWSERGQCQLSQAEQSQQKQSLNQVPEQGAFTDLAALLLWQCQQQPDAVAVRTSEAELSFAELVQQAGHIAQLLLSLGQQQDQCIGLFMEPSADLICGVWGILFAGGCYLPLSPEYPQERLQYMLSDAGVSVVLTQRHLRAQLEQLVPESVTIFTVEDLPAGLHHFMPLLSAQQLAYMIYTSGSTGKPKGVMIEQRSIAAQMQWLAQQYGFDQRSAILQKTPFSFDAAQWEILCCAMGATVVIGAPGIYRDPPALLDTVAELGVTVLQGVPTLLQALLEVPGNSIASGLKFIFSGGELLTRQLASDLLASFPGCRLVNLYGPTECTINSSAFEVTASQLHQLPLAVPVGYPVAQCRYYVLDAELQPVASGEIGELYISGIQLARGYYQRPDLSAERFIANPHSNDPLYQRLYRTGDLARVDPDGNTHFVGRVDNQVKLRGYRVELDEIRLQIEKHRWIKNAAVLVQQDSRTGTDQLIACIELDKQQASLMDQGRQGAHHQSKQNKLQVKAQLSNAGLRQEQELLGQAQLPLPGAEATAQQKALVFARKTYRFFQGGAVSALQLEQLLQSMPPKPAQPKPLSSLSFADFGYLLRYFGQFHSADRLLPKYGFASPGALYATQLYLEIDGLFGLDSGYYYYQPKQHSLYLVAPKSAAATPALKLHFIGRTTAIEPVYQNNIAEVLEMEAGHMLGLFDQVLPQFGLGVQQGTFAADLQTVLAGNSGDLYLGSFAIDSWTTPVCAVEQILQVQPGAVAGLAAGQYLWQPTGLQFLDSQLIEASDVIAINQQVYQRASFGIGLLSRQAEPWYQYIALGRRLQQLQQNPLQLGMMSSGYSSKSGHPLRAAVRMDELCQARQMPQAPFYFAIGGQVSPQQQACTGMQEDSIHMRGPAEILRDELQSCLPAYMVPNNIVVFDSFPQTANGKIDLQALRQSPQVQSSNNAAPMLAPRNDTETLLLTMWQQSLRLAQVSVLDDFFACGGNSLKAVALMHQINQQFGLQLPMQAIFTAPTIEALAALVQQTAAASQQHSRLLPLQQAKTDNAANIFCWPGLGGYPLNLRLLADATAAGQNFYGVKAQGLEPGETIQPDISAMALADISLLKQVQPQGPYRLWGYSFGARVAFEVAYQLEQQGEVVEQLFLLAPGSPVLAMPNHSGLADFNEPAFVTVLYSVFAQKISGPLLQLCLQTVSCQASFVDFICQHYRQLPKNLVDNIVSLVRQTYQYRYSFTELSQRRLKVAPVLFKARGDDYAFIEAVGRELGLVEVQLEACHYSLLQATGMKELSAYIQRYQQLSRQLATLQSA